MSINLRSFDNKEVKNTYKSIAKMSDGNRKSKKIIDTDEERNALRAYVSANWDNINTNDRYVLSQLSGIDFSTPVLNVEIEGNNNDVLIVTGENNTVVDTFVKQKETVETDPVEVIKEPETEIEEVQEETIQNTVLEQPETPKTKPYNIKKGDYWYKMVSEEYETASNSEITAIVRKFKQEYFEKNKSDLIRKGYTSAKSGFFLPVGSTFELPETVEVNGKTYKLKNENAAVSNAI